MENKNEESANVTAFDALYTTNDIQKCKVLLPYIEPSMQKHLAVYIKYMELQYTMRYVRNHPLRICGNGGRPDLRSLFGQLRLFSTPAQISQLEQLQNMMQMMETMQQISSTMSVLQEMFPDLAFDPTAAPPFASGSVFPGQESAESAQNGGFSMMDMMLSMLTPEQRNMYEAFYRTGESAPPDDDAPTDGSCAG